MGGAWPESAQREEPNMSHRVKGRRLTWVTVQRGGAWPESQCKRGGAQLEWQWKGWSLTWVTVPFHADAFPIGAAELGDWLTGGECWKHTERTAKCLKSQSMLISLLQFFLASKYSSFPLPCEVRVLAIKIQYSPLIFKMDLIFNIIN